MATYDILSSEEMTNEEDKVVKTAMQVKFIKDDETESAEQRYEVDGNDEDEIATQLQAAADEYNERE